MDFDFDRITIKLGPWKFGFDLKARQMDEMTRHAGCSFENLHCSAILCCILSYLLAIDSIAAHQSTLEVWYLTVIASWDVVQNNCSRISVLLHVARCCLVPVMSTQDCCCAYFPHKVLLVRSVLLTTFHS